MTTSKPPGHRPSRRTSASKPHPRSPPGNPTPASELAGFPGLTAEWWKSWRQANALGWDYLNAVTELMRLNMSALGRVPRFVTPFGSP